MNFEKIIVTSPADYKIIGEIEASTSKEIDQKLALARQSFDEWSNKSVEQRIEILKNLLQAFNENKEKIAEIIAKEVGIPISVCMKIDIEVGLNYFQGYLENALNWLKPEIVFENEKEQHILFFEGLGVVGISIPWNFPFTNFIWAAIQNLIVGNTVVIKHSENCSLTAKFLEKIVESIKPLKNICNFIYGKGHDAGDYLIHANIDMIWFVGGVATGNYIYKVAALKGIPVILELGGSAPAIICEDVDIDEVVESVYFYRFANSGQSCDAIKRVIIHEKLFEKFIEKLSNLLNQKKVGDPLNSTTDIGPLINKKQLEVIQNQVLDATAKGAKIICGDKQPEKLVGAFYLPTLITNISYDMKIWTEEIFGPVLPVVTFKTDEEAINLANQTSFGLGGYVYSKNKNRAMEIARFLKTGNISINGVNYVIPQDPFGGYKKSGIGRTHGKIGMQGLCQVKVIATNK